MSAAGRKPSDHRRYMRELLAGWSDRTFSTYYATFVRTRELVAAGGPDVFAEALQLATRQNGSVNVSRFARIVEARTIAWLIASERSA